MSQKLLADGFECAEETFQFNKYYIEKCHKDSDVGC